MRIRRHVGRYGWLPVAGSAVLGGAAIALLLVALRAYRVEPLPDPVPHETGESLDISVSAGAEAPAVRALLDANPFHPERRRPAARYQPPRSETDGDAAPVPMLVLTGTILYPDGGGAAIVKHGGQSSQIVRRGAALGGLTLTSVERGRATFTASDGSPVVLVSSGEGGS